LILGPDCGLYPRVRLRACPSSEHRCSGSRRRRAGAAAPTARVILILIALLAVAAGSRAHTADGAEAPALSSASAFGTVGKTILGGDWTGMTDHAKRGSRYLYDGPAGSELYQVTGPLRGDPSGDGVQTVDAAVYADQGGEPGALLAQSALNAVIAGGQATTLVNFPLAQAVPLQPGAHYWLMFHAGQAGAVAEYSYAVVQSALRYETPGADLKLDGAEDPAGPMLVDHRELTIWGSYRPIAPGPSTPDRDADGVADADDRCPDASGPAGEAGCPSPKPPSPPDPTPPLLPQAATAHAQGITPDSALLTGIVVPHGDTRWFFEWGPTARFGRQTTAQSLPAGAGATQVRTSLTGLRPSTRYRFRLVAEGPGGRIEGNTQSFVALSPPQIEPALSVRLRCRPTAPSCRIERSSLTIGLRGPGGRLARAAQHSDLHVRLVLRRGGRVLATRGFDARARVRLRALAGPRLVTLRRDVVDRTSRYALGALFRDGFAIGTALEVYVTREGAIGGYYRFALRRKGKLDFVVEKTSCVIPVGARTLRTCRRP
jgi:hypothetical protein